MTRLVFLAALALAACNGVPFSEVTQVYSDSPEVALALTHAIDRVVAASGVDVVYGRGHGAVEFRRGATDADVSGVWNPITREVTLSRRLRPGTGLDTVTLHELMHALGAGHVAQGDGVMSPDPDTRLITSADLDTLCASAECTRYAPESDAP